MNLDVQKRICVVTPVTRRSPKIEKALFWEKRPLNRKSAKFDYETIHQHMNLIHVFLPIFVEIRKAKVTKTMHGISHKKGKYFASFSRASGEISPKMLEGHPFRGPHPSAEFLPNRSSFREDTKMSFSVITVFNVCLLPLWRNKD